MAVIEAAEDQAKHSPAGRLPIPLVAVLDEAANICRWRELPNLYSHYGSRASAWTFLQSWSQGVDVWGETGMRKLWSSANVKVYGGGVDERDFLASLSDLIGEIDLPQPSVSYHRPPYPGAAPCPGWRASHAAAIRDSVAAHDPAPAPEPV